MKKFCKALAIILVFLTLAFAFTACSGADGEVKIIVINGDQAQEYVIDTTGSEMGDLLDAFEYLKEDTGCDFTYELSGTFLTSVNGYSANSSSNEFWAIYTDLEIGGIKYYDISWGTVTYNGVEYASASKGVGELPLNGGSTYIIKLYPY